MYPLVFAESAWMNSQLSVARFSGCCQLGGQRYIIVDKHGRDLLECSRIAEKEGREKAIEPGEPADLIDSRLQKAYKRLGRDRIIELLRGGKSLTEINKTKK